MTKFRVAIIGCKNMGTKHLKVLREYFSHEVEIVGILNSTSQSSAAKAAELECPHFNDISEIDHSNTDAAIICVPAISHAVVGKELLQKGIFCLMEKPLAVTLEECDELINAARAAGLPLMVGHTENYNPAVIKLKEVIQLPVKKINGIRTSQGVDKNRVISVVPELMIHDLAIVRDLIPESPTTINSEIRPDKNFTDHTNVFIEYASGAKVCLESLIDYCPVSRFMEIVDSADNLYHIDFRECRLLKNGETLCSGGNSLQNELGVFVRRWQQKELFFDDAQHARDIVALCLKIEAALPSHL